MNTVQVRALRNTCVSPGRSMQAGEVGVVDPLTAATLLQQLAATLVHPADAGALRKALRDDVRRQDGGKIHRPPRESPWLPFG